LTTNANAQTTRLRRDVTKLDNSDPFFAKYGQAVKRMHELPGSDQRNWRNQALIHINHCAHGLSHGEPDFPHWHRHYTANFELICGELIGDPGFALTYWNWSANRGRIPDPFFDLDLLNVEHWRDPSNASSPQWGTVRTVGTRNLSKTKGLQDFPGGGAFTDAAIKSLQRLSNYQVWRPSLEGSPHGLGHTISGGANGHMGNGMSPLDPIFWLHHCNVDRLWAEWQGAGNTAPALNQNYNGHFVDGKGQPVVTASSANALDIANFNYTYESALVAFTAQRLALQPAENQKILQGQAVDGAPQTLGADNTAKTVTTAVETRFTVTASGLIPSLFRPRTYWAPDTLGVKRLGAETGRLLAQFSNVSAPEGDAPIVVSVFVNCPYLSPETPWEDPHYAGSFSFFGTGATHTHAPFVVDITSPLRTLIADGQIATEQLNVQLMAVPVDPTAPGQATFSVGGVEILRV
jgi:tyrosinase